MDRLTAEQVRRNTMGRDRWEAFASHRAQVTARLLSAACGEDGRLCVLGAGNCNDIDLGQLTKRYREVHLVDLDGAALAEGILSQPAANAEKVHLHANTDVTGIWPQLAAWTASSPNADVEVERLLTTLQDDWRPELPAPFDVVASVCLLSQLIEGPVVALGKHARLLEMVMAVRNAHMRLLARLLACGGRGVLVSDFVSSDTLPALVTLSEGEVPFAVREALAQGNCFHGLHPQSLENMFRTDPAMKHAVVDIRLTGPWRWYLKPRAHAVCAIEFRRL